MTTLLYCTDCKKHKTISEFPSYRGKTGNLLYRKQCKKCHNKKHLKRVYGNKEQAAKKRERDNRWRKNNPTNVLQFRARQKENQKRLTDQYRDELTNTYVLNRLGFNSNTDIPEILIEVKRLHLQIIRLLEDKRS